MRRTAITTLLIMGVPEAMVRKISGHAPGSKEFYKYVGIAQDYFKPGGEECLSEIDRNSFYFTSEKQCLKFKKNALFCVEI